MTATAGEVSGSASVSILDPQAGPVVSTPQVAFKATGAVRKRKAPMVVSWTASSDAGSIVAVELQRTIDGGGWLNMMLPAPAPASVVKNFKFGRRYVVRVRVTDSAGMTSPWVHSPAFTLLAYNENSQSINRSTGWTNVSSYYSVGSQFGRSAIKGASVALNYSGLQVAVIGNRGAKHGLADVYVGPSAVRVGPIDLRRSRRQLRRVLFVSQAPTNYAASASRIEMRNASTGTRKRADFDAFIVLAPLD